MSGLVLKLSPKERVLINGAVLENGDRRSRFSIVTPGANILRLKDAIHPDEIDTPVKRVCYIAQLVLSGDSQEADARNQLISSIEELSQVFTDDDSRQLIAQATNHTVAGQFYQALKSLKELLPREVRLLSVKTQ